MTTKTIPNTVAALDALPEQSVMTSETRAEAEARLPDAALPTGHTSDCWTDCTTRYTPKEKP